MSNENVPLLALFFDGDLLAAATQPKKPTENQTISSAMAPKPELSVPQNLVGRIEQHFFGGKCATRIKTCFFTAGADADPEVKAHKAAVISAMKAAGFQCKVQSVDRAYSTDAVITSKAMKVLYKNHSVTTFVFLTHSPHLEAILDEVTDDGKDSFLVALGVTGAANIAPEVKALLCSSTKTGQSSVLTLQSSDLFGVPFDEAALSGATPFSNRKPSAQTAAPATAAPTSGAATTTAAPVMPVTTPPPLADQPNPLTAPAATTAATATPAPATTPAPTPTAAPAAAATNHAAEEGSRPLRDQADPTNQLGATTPAPAVATPTAAGAPPAQPAIADFRLAPGCTAYWDKNYKRYYYVVTSPGQPNVTTWSHPGGAAEHARIEGLVAQWNAQVTAAAASAQPAAAPAPAPTVAAPQPAAVPVAKVEPEPAPVVVPTYANVPANDKNAIAAAQLQAQPVVLNPPVAQPTPAPAPPTPSAGSAPLPKGWERHVDQASGRPYYYDTINKKTTWELPPQ